jgi:TetR/AcrR family transcriptional regulator
MPTEKSKETAQSIIDAGTTLFTQKGFYNVSIKEIATKAGSNSALISYYFGGKKELYQEILKRQAADINALQKTVSSSSQTALEKLYNYILGIKMMQAKNKQQANLLYREILFPTGLCSAMVNEQLTAIHLFTVDLVKAAVKEKSLKPSTDPAYTAFILEGITVLTFLARKQLNLLGSAGQSETGVVQKVITYYFNSLLTGKEAINHANV